MNIRVATVCLCLLVAAAIIYGAGVAKAPSAAPALKSHHLFNLPEEISEAELTSAFQEINRVISDSGHPDAGYRLWKVIFKQAGEYGYLWEGVWPDRATYDAIHEDENYEKVLERFRPMLDPVMRIQLYNRFIEIPTNGPGT